MSGVSAQMPRYVAHKKVWALKIAELALEAPSGDIGEAGPLGAIITPADSRYAPFKVDAAYVEKHSPKLGGYYVVYEDGYKSFSPAEAFEQGYTALDGPRVIDPAHRYRIGGGQVLQFLKKERVPAPEGAQVSHYLETTALGTTNEELIEVLIDRIRGLNAAVPCRENSLAITKLEEALHWLESRTKTRVAQRVEGTAAAHI
jgi:hypothetical protein